MQALEAFVTRWCLERERFGTRVSQAILNGPDGFLGSFQQILGKSNIYIYICQFAAHFFGHLVCPSCRTWWNNFPLPLMLRTEEFSGFIASAGSSF